jgi:hypothetical protein
MPSQSTHRELAKLLARQLPDHMVVLFVTGAAEHLVLLVVIGAI